jgi:hypothetical protein
MNKIYNLHDGAQAQLMLGDKAYKMTNVMIVTSNPSGASWIAQRFRDLGHTVVIRKPDQMQATEPTGVLLFDELVPHWPPLPVLPKQTWSPKCKQLIAQLNRAKAQRNKNLVRDLTRQLEALGYAF